MRDIERALERERERDRERETERNGALATVPLTWHTSKH